MTPKPVVSAGEVGAQLPSAGAEASERIRDLPVRLRVVTVLPLVALVGVMVLVGLLAPENVHRAPLVLLGLNFVFTTLVSFFVLYLALRGFLVQGQPGLLLLASGAMVWGLGTLLSTTVGWRDANAAETIENATALLSGAFHLGGVFTWRFPRLRVREPDRVAVATLGAALAAIAAITAGALTGASPVVFVQGRGATPLGEVIAGGAVAAWALAAAVLASRRRPLGAFTARYAMALALFAAGLATELVEASVGDALDWIGRGTLFLGGAYLLAAALSGVRDAQGWVLSLEAGLAEARTQLREREARYQSFFENLEETVALYEPVRDAGGAPVDWIIRDANERFAAVFGLPRARAVGARVSEALGGELLAQWAPRWREVLETGRTIQYERNIRGRTAEVTCFRMGDLVAATGLDVTERLRMERAVRDSERLYRAIGESIRYGVWVCAPDGRNVYASESFLELVGLTQQQCSDGGWGEALHPEDAARTRAAWKECVRNGEGWDVEQRFRGVDGRWHPVLARGVPVRDEQGEIVCFAGINLDIGRLKEAEQRLRESDERKSEFLAVLSHELRNPLAPIRSAVEVLDRAPRDGPEAQRAREVIERQVGHLARLVDDLLDATRVSRGRVTLARQPLDLRGAVLRACEDHRPLFSEQGVALRVEAPEPVPVDADPTRVAQVVGNLLQNASRFTPRGGSVAVTVGAAGGRARLRVEDDGIGIEPALLGRIFDPFTQSERSLARTRGGLGLGLTLVKGLVELHGGTVAAESAGPGRGAAFVVTLPLAAPEVRPEPARPQAPAALDVLIVEDSRDAADALVDLLTICGHRVRLARDGRGGIELVRAGPPDVVLCDLGLPDLDGYAVAREIRADPALRRVLLVALSGYARPEDRARATAAGFDAHLSKPASLEDIEAVLARASRRAAQV